MSNIPIFIIHYKKLTERKEYLSRRLNELGFSNVNWVEDIDRDTMTDEQLAMYQFSSEKWYELNLTWFHVESRPRYLSKGEIACGVTHILIYKHIIDNNIKNAIIFEDDVILYDNFVNIDKILEELPSDYHTCFLNDAFGWTVENYKHNYFKSMEYIPGKNVYKMGCSKCADSFLISYEGAKLLYNNIIPFCLPIDWMHNPIYINNNMNVYWAQPALTHQGSEDIYKSSVGREQQLSNVEEKIEEDEIAVEGLYNLVDGTYVNENFTENFEQLEHLTEKLNNCSNFIAVRYGSDDFQTMISTNENSINVDNCSNFKKLCSDLLKSYIYFLKNDNAYILSKSKIGYLVEDDLKNKNKISSNMLYSDILLNKLPVNKYQLDFYKTLKKSNRMKIYISNISMINALIPVLNISYGIIVPEINCYTSKKIVTMQIIDLIKKINKDNLIFLFSAGSCSNIIVHEISKLYPNNTYIDIGSSFDGLIRKSRDFNGTVEYQEELIKCYS